MTDPRLTTAADMARECRIAADKSWPDVDRVISHEDEAARYAALAPDTIIPRF
jgi:hypothetical protein